MTPLSRGIISSAKGAASVPIFPVSTVSLNGTTQYLLSTNSSLYNFGTDSVFISGWVRSDLSSTLYFKGNEAGVGGQDLFIQGGYEGNGDIVFDLSLNNSNRRQWITTAKPVPLDGDWHHIAVYHARTNDGTAPTLWVDSVSQGAMPVFFTAGSGWASANFTQTQPVRMGVVPIPAFFLESTGAFVNTIKGYSPTQLDIDELYNDDTPLCYDDVDGTLKAQFMSFIDCGTFNGSTEAQARTERVESHLFTNVNSAPFTGTGLSVECN